MANDDLQAWTNAFYRQMQSSELNGLSAVTTPRGSTLADLLLASQQPNPLSSTLQHADPVQSSPNIFERGLDILSRGAYAAGNFVDAASNNMNPNLPKQDVWSEVGKGITGKDKTTISQVIDERTDLPAWAQIPIGFAADITLDPTNLIPGAAIARGASAVRGAVTGATRTAKALEDAAKVAAKAKEAESASELAAKKLAEAQATGTTVDPSITDQILSDSKKVSQGVSLDDSAGLAWDKIANTHQPFKSLSAASINEVKDEYTRMQTRLFKLIQDGEDGIAKPGGDAIRRNEYINLDAMSNALYERLRGQIPEDELKRLGDINSFKRPEPVTIPGAAPAAPAASNVSSADNIRQMLDDLAKTKADTIKEQIGGNTYLDPETIVANAQKSRIDLRNPEQAKMEADLTNVITPDDMKAWRKLYKDQFPKVEQAGLSSVRDVAKFKTMATNFMARAKAPEATTLSDILLNPEAFHPDTIADVLKTHDAASLRDMAHKYRFTDDTMDTTAKTIISPPVKKANEVAQETAAQIAEARRIAAETGVAPPMPKSGLQQADDSLMESVKALQAANKLKQTPVEDIKVAEKTAQKSAKDAEATPTRTTPPKVIGNEAQGKSIQKYVREANKANADAGIRGVAASASTRDSVLARMQTIEDHFRAQGDDPFVHTGPLTAATRRFHISSLQALKAIIAKSPEYADLVDKTMFNASTGIGTEAFQQGLAETLRLYDDYLARGGTEPWTSAGNNAAQTIHEAMEAATDTDYLKQWTNPTGSAKRQAYYKKMLPVMLEGREQLAEVLDELAPQLHQIAADNIAARNASNAIDSKAIADSVNEAIDHAAENSAAAGLKEISEAIDDVKARSEEIGASPKASYAASAKIATDIYAKYGVTAEQVKRLRQVAEARAKNGERAQSQATRLGREQAKADAKEADEVGKEAFGPEYDYDMSQQFNARFTNSFMKTIAPLGRMFSYGYKAGEFATILKEGRSAAYTIGKRYEKLLTNILRTTTKEERLELHDAIRMGRRPQDGTKEAKLFDDLKEAYDISYDTSVFAKSDSPLFTNWFAQGIPLEEINKAYAAVGLKYRFKPPKEDGHWSDVPAQWRDWEVDDPIDFAHKSFEAMQRVAANKSVATHAAEKWGVKTRPGPGWVKLTDKSGESSIIPYMDTSLWYPEELAHQIANLDWMMQQAVSFASSKNGMGKFVREVVDPYMQLWKPLITIAKPGHHLRNITGDFFISALDIGFLGLGPAYAKAARIMHGNRAFKGAQAITQTAGLVEKIGPNAGAERIGVALKGGKKVMLDDANVYKLAFQRGMLPEFTKSEDLIRNEGSGLLSKVASKVTSSKPMQKVGEFAEYSSHVGRMAHFVALMERKSFTRKFGSLEEASRAAAERVKRFHPDTSGLSPFEQKYMRRIFPFYTWIRQSAPVVMGALFTRPGRIMAVPKIQYNMALAMGVNPDSLGNPFPDGNYPSWLRDSMTGPIGPGGNMMNLGSPQEGILPDYLSSNPLRTAANQLTPFIKQPTEFLSGTKLQTGTPLASADQSEFWDQIVPGASAIGQLTSTSPVGTLGNLIAGQGLDPLRNVVRDKQNRYVNRNLINFLSGLTISNAETPTMESSAYYERMGGR